LKTIFVDVKLTLNVLKMHMRPKSSNANDARDTIMLLKP
jgi:hypothetical protein